MQRSLQSLLPFALATLGWFISLVAGNMPLFEWHISKLVTDFPLAYEVLISPSPWTARFRDSLDDGLYIFQNIWVTTDGKMCLTKDFHFAVMRSRSDRMMEQALNINATNLLRLYTWGQLEIGLLVLYLWVFTIWHERLWGFIYATVSTFIAGAIFIWIFEITRFFGNTPHLSMSDIGQVDCRGAVTFNAELLKTHYETPIVLVVAIGLELGALVLTFYQIRKSVNAKKESSKSVLG